MSTEIEREKLRNDYSIRYRDNTSDSPIKSRESLITRLSAAGAVLKASDTILDLGSGNQAIARDYLQQYGTLPACMVTLDFANISSSLLVPHPQISHVRADGTKLPFADDSISLVVSNMAYDFILGFGEHGKDGVSDLYRVMKPGAQALMNLHHPELIPGILDIMLKYPERFSESRERLLFWKELREKKILFPDETAIVNTFTHSGFQVQSVGLGIQSYDGLRFGAPVYRDDKWWEVAIVNPN